MKTSIAGRWLVVWLVAAWVGGGGARAQAPRAPLATPLPGGYRFSRVAPGGGHQPTPLRYDFDGDGIPDVVAVVEARGGDALATRPQLMAWLSGRAGRPPLTHPPTDDLDCCASFTRRGQLLLVHSDGMRYFETYAFRYDARQRDLELIGVDTESFGNAANDGAGTTSYNLLTGQYVAALHTYDERAGRLRTDAVVRRTRPRPPRRYYLSSFDQALAYFNSPAFPK